MDNSDRMTELAGAAAQSTGESTSIWDVYVSWQDLLNVSWPVPLATLRPMVPAALDIDVYDGTGWLSLIAFRACDARLAGKLPLPGASNFPELNCRTYVKLGENTGVFFFSIDSPSWMAEILGRHLFHLPFQTSAISIEQAGDTLRVDMQRRGAQLPDAAFAASYTPRGSVATPAAGTLDDFLTNRLNMYVPDGHGGLKAGRIWHEPWRVQPVDVTIATNTVAAAVGIVLPDQPPHAAFGPKTETIGHPLQPIGADASPQ